MPKPRNGLTLEQELAVRTFIDSVQSLNIGIQPRTMGDLLNVLGYRVLPNGTPVKADLQVQMVYGEVNPYDKYENQYEKDREKVMKEAREKIYGEDSSDVPEDSDTASSGTSEPPTSK